MQYVGGEICVPRRVNSSRSYTKNQLQAAAKSSGVNPNSIRIRDIHSFYNQNPNLSAPEREQKFVVYSQTLDILYKELLEHREMAVLKEESDIRMRNLLISKLARKNPTKLLLMDWQELDIMMKKDMWLSHHSNRPNC